MADRRLRFPLLWLVFSAVMVTGAGLLLSRDPAKQAWGLGILLSPILAFTVVGLVYYVRERRKRAGRPGA